MVKYVVVFFDFECYGFIGLNRTFLVSGLIFLWDDIVDQKLVLGRREFLLDFEEQMIKKIFFLYLLSYHFLCAQALDIFEGFYR